MGTPYHISNINRVSFLFMGNIICVLFFSLLLFSTGNATLPTYAPFGSSTTQGLSTTPASRKYCFFYLGCGSLINKVPALRPSIIWETELRPLLVPVAFQLLKKAGKVERSLGHCVSSDLPELSEHLVRQ